MSTIQQNLIDLFNLEKMSPDQIASTVDRLAKLVFQASLVRALPMLKEEDLVEYEKIVSQENSGEVLFKFLKEKVEDFDKIIEEESKNLHQELSGEFEAIP